MSVQESVLQTDGKFFLRKGRRHWMKAVTYGPFPPGKELPLAESFRKIRQAGFDTIRLFTLPHAGLLDEAGRAGLMVFAGLDWNQHVDFISQPGAFSSARVRLSGWLEKHAGHSALAGIYVGNEIRTDLVRWMGPVAVRKSIEELIALGKEIAPHLLFAYANYPSTEYLEPANADFTAFNIYLERSEEFATYLRRLQNIAGDRPLVISEFGLDTARNSDEIQASVFDWALEISHREETAGFTVFSWSDLWTNGGREILDWDFGLNARDGSPKPALEICRQFHPTVPDHPLNSFSIIVCTRNGSHRIGNCLNAIAELTGGPFETIVVDDGSTDGTSEFVATHFPSIRLFTIPPSGLSVARNLGAYKANGQVFAFTDDDCEPDPDWIVRLDRAFHDPQFAAAGGPNLPPPARTSQEAVIRAAPGAPSHVLLDDNHAEHLPGCNIAVRREAFEAIGGFDPVFHTAGDDVDFCWRLSDNGFHLGFVPGAFVWHWRRSSVFAFLMQQIGYGKAEKLLLAKHPNRFGSNGEAHWTGFIYGGGTINVDNESIIYHGPMGKAGYQSIVNRTLPLRPIDWQFRNTRTEWILKLVCILQPAMRRWARNRRVKFARFRMPGNKVEQPHHEIQLRSKDGLSREHFLNLLLADGWTACGDTSAWDLEKGRSLILIATEHLGHGITNNLFRIQGEFPTLPFNI